MENGQNMFLDFILERTLDDKKEEMTEFLKDAFKPPEDGKFDPDGMRKRNEVMMAMMTPEGAEEFKKMMSFGGNDEPIDEELLNKNWLAQPNGQRWKDESPEVSKDEMRAAFACSKKADGMTCDCWNTNCQFFGDCRKCIVFHTCLKQFPTCQRSYLGDYEEHYIVFSRDTDK